VSTPPAKFKWLVCSSFAAAGISIGLALFSAFGCGAPGEPVPPSPPVAAQISDLAARQAGDGVQLTFTMPVRSIAGDRLTSTPAVEILRGSAKPDGSPDLKSLRVVDTIPGSLADKYFVGDKFQFLDPIAPEEIKTHPGAVVIYTVRTRLSQKRASANSNILSLRVFSVPGQIAQVEIHVTESAIGLNWPAVDRTSAGDPLNSSPRYNIYRAELDDAEVETAKHDVSHLKLNARLQLLASQPENTFSDKSFEFGKTYAYVVRGVVTIENAAVESADSSPAIVTPRDTFPPATPQALSAAILPGETEGSLVVDLSWSINVETDFAGYRLYRSEQQDATGQPITSELLPTPAYRDTSVQPAHHYWYAVTAVDRAGNESAPSPPVAVEIVQPSP
jgi:uncharacterized protein